MGPNKRNHRNKNQCSAGTYIRAIARDLGKFLIPRLPSKLKEFQLVALMKKLDKNI